MLFTLLVLFVLALFLLMERTLFRKPFAKPFVFVMLLPALAFAADAAPAAPAWSQLLLAFVDPVLRLALAAIALGVAYSTKHLPALIKAHTKSPLAATAANALSALVTIGGQVSASALSDLAANASKGASVGLSAAKADAAQQLKAIGAASVADLLAHGMSQSSVDALANHIVNGGIDGGAAAPTPVAVAAVAGASGK
jgi:hypothetical protein